MDPLSIAASAVAIIQVSTELVIGTRNFYKSVKNTPTEISALVDELDSLKVVLEHLESFSREAQVSKASQIIANGSPGSHQKATRLPMLQKMMEANGPLSICYEEMLRFLTKLTKDGSKVKKFLRWPFEKDEIIAVLGRLRNLKSVLDTAIATDQLSVFLAL